MSVLSPLIMTFFWAMVPLLELRFAIPYGVARGLEPWTACVAAVLGNMIPVPFVVLLARRACNWLRDTRLLGPRIGWLERRAHLKGRLVRKYRLLGLTVLVAVPLPGTGAWTGALVASVLDIRLRDAMPAILLGLVIAGGIITALTVGMARLI